MNISISNIETKQDKNGKDYLLLTTPDGKMGCFDKELFSGIKNAYAEGEDYEGDIKVNGKYKSVVGVGKGGENSSASSPGQSSRSPSSPQHSPDWDAINREKCKEIDIAGSLTNAANLVSHTCSNLPTAEQLVQVEDIATRLIAIKKRLREGYNA